MINIKEYISSLRIWFKSLRPRREKIVSFAESTMILDARWRHERKYIDYINKGVVNGPIAMDAWVLSRFVKPGDVVLDAGANIGFTGLLAKKYGASEIHCFEPDPRLIERLKVHCQTPEFKIYEMALGESKDFLLLRMSEAHNQGSTLSDKIVSRYPKLFQGSKSTSVQVDTIDNIFGDKRFDLLKIDVEGAELATLKGAAKMLESNPPSIIYIEIYPEFLVEVQSFLQRQYPFGYRVVCDHLGDGELYCWDYDVGQLDGEKFFTVPPSYVFSSRDLSAYVKH